MSKQEELLFCKIAIETGRVSEDEAKRCLAYANKLEASGQARPRMGTVFVKAKLLGQQDVQRIYQAMQRRQGAVADSTATRTRLAQKRGRGKRGTASARRSPESSAPTRDRTRPGAGPRRVSSRSMVFSILSLVAVFVMLGVIGLLLYYAGSSDGTVAQTEVEEKKPEEKRVDLVVKSNAVDLDQLERIRNGVNQSILDARSFRGDERYGMALRRLTEFDTQNKSYLQRDSFQEFQQKLAREIEVIKGRIATEFDSALEKASQLAGDGNVQGAVSHLEMIKDRVDSEYVAKIDAEIKKILGE